MVLDSPADKQGLPGLLLVEERLVSQCHLAIDKHDSREKKHAESEPAGERDYDTPLGREQGSMG